MKVPRPLGYAPPDPSRRETLRGVAVAVLVALLLYGAAVMGSDYLAYRRVARLKAKQSPATNPTPSQSAPTGNGR